MTDGEPAHARVLDLLLAFANRPVWTVEALAEQMGATKSTTYRFIKSLRERDLVVRRSTGEYSLGPAILSLASHVELRGSLSEVALPVMRKLAVDSGESVILTVVVGNKALALEQVSGPQPLNLSFKPGTLHPLHVGASSKILLANLPEPAFTEAVTAVTTTTGYSDHPVTDIDALLADLAGIREQGVAITEGEYEPGVKAVACPVFDARKTLKGAISIAGPAHRMPSTSDRRLAELLTAAVEAVGLHLNPTSYG
ncbi:transcriptional regulator [Micromonospora qiuiae]|uniref:Transcriptional regulator n=1 Tax=Micromonospora qiuiae TaxID=502268 RepID=A0ABQ4JJK3_9ACTN|nr:IclR family transcriptional regulator [Micromonospora qiuiae]GIJ30530.1 transcriptional regulator [Micromonospora qiuiae]